MRLFGAAVIAAITGFLGGSAQAQDVVLRSTDGMIAFEGDILGFDGIFYRLATDAGELTLDGADLVCDGAACPDLDRPVTELKLSGAASLGAVLVPALIEAYARQAGWSALRIDEDETHYRYELTANDRASSLIFRVRMTDADEGFADLLADEADVVLSERVASEEEIALAREVGLGDLRRAGRNAILGFSAFVPVASPLNPVESIDPSTLAAALGGTVPDWTALGGTGPIALHLHRRGLAGFDWANDEIGTTRHESFDALDAEVARDRQALGVVPLGSAAVSKVLGLAGSCGITLPATVDAVRSGDYPVAHPLYMYLPERRLSAAARDFFRFLRSPVARQVVRRVGYVDTALETVALPKQGNRLANAIRAARSAGGLSQLEQTVDTLSPLRRLTLSLRFEGTGIGLTLPSQLALRSVVLDLVDGVLQPRTLTLVGFSDGQGTAAENRVIARQRAEAVRDLLVSELAARQGPEPEITVEAFGEAMPLACDDTPFERGLNRRVEIWVR